MKKELTENEKKTIVDMVEELKVLESQDPRDENEISKKRTELREFIDSTEWAKGS